MTESKANAGVIGTHYENIPFDEFKKMQLKNKKWKDYEISDLGSNTKRYEIYFQIEPKNDTYDPHDFKIMLDKNWKVKKVVEENIF